MIPLNVLQQASLNGPAITICRCWEIIRKDGIALRLTDHDEFLNIGGVNYSPIDSLQASAASKSAGAKIRDREIKSVLSSDLITESDLLAGMYKDAQIKEFVYDWANPSSGIFLRDVYWVASTEYNGHNWTANIESLTSWMTKASGGRNHERDCGNVFGTGICGQGVNLESIKVAGTVGAVIVPSVVFNSTVTTEANTGQWEGIGEILFTSGLNSGYRYPIKGHTNANGRFALWLEPVREVVTGDTFYAYPGCTMRIEDCIAWYGNLMNFTGFPYLVGQDRMFQSPDGD